MGSLLTSTLLATSWVSPLRPSRPATARTSPRRATPSRCTTTASCRATAPSSTARATVARPSRPPLVSAVSSRLGRRRPAAERWPEGAPHLHARLRLRRARFPPHDPRSVYAHLRGRAPQDQLS